MVWFSTIWWLVGDIIVGDDNAAAKWDPPASRDGHQMAKLSFLETAHILSPDYNDA